MSLFNSLFLRAVGVGFEHVGVHVGFGEFDELVEGRGVVDRNFGECFAVQNTEGALQAVDEFTVPQSAHPAGGVDADDPESTELTLLRFAVPERKRASANEGDNGLSEQVVPTEPEALRQLPSAFPTSR